MLIKDTFKTNFHKRSCYIFSIYDLGSFDGHVLISSADTLTGCSRFKHDFQKWGMGVGSIYNLGGWTVYGNPWNGNFEIFYTFVSPKIGWATLFLRPWWVSRSNFSREKMFYYILLIWPWFTNFFFICNPSSYDRCVKIIVLVSINKLVNQVF